jgi:ubiquinone/menaquinone biosynthesis C-methylase UbiE
LNDLQDDFEKWAEIYDQVYSDVTEDICFYKNLATHVAGPILEIGCGTGRVTIPLAQEGCLLEAIDISENMIALLKSKIKNNNLNISCYTMDMKNLNIPRKFPLIIIPFNGFQSMLSLSNQYECLTSIREHILPDGILSLDMFPPSMDMFDQNQKTWYQVKEIFHEADSSTVLVNHSSKYELGPQLIHTKLMIKEVINDEIIKTTYKDFSLRYSNRYESEYLFKNAGFKIEKLYGNFNLDQFNETSEKMIWILKPQRHHIV